MTEEHARLARPRSRFPTSATSRTSRSSRSTSRWATRSTPTTRWSRWSPTRRPWTCRRRQAGTVEEILVKVGDKVSEGTPILMLQAAATAPMTQPPSLIAQQEPPPQPSRPRRPARPPPGRASADRRPAPRRRPPTSAASTPARACAGWRASSGRPDQAQGHRREGPDHQGRRARPSCAGRRRPRPVRPRPRAAWASRRSRRGLLQVRADRDQAAVAHQEASPARSCTAPGSTSRTSPTTTRPTSPSSTPTARSSTTPPRRQGPTGSRCWPFLMKASVSALRAFPEFNSSLSPGEGQPDPQEILQHRHRRRHAGGAGGAGRQGRRPQGHRRAEPGAGPRPRSKARDGKLGAGRHAGRHASPSPASAASAAPTSRRSSTRPRWRSWAWCARRWRRSGTARSSSRG